VESSRGKSSVDVGIVVAVAEYLVLETVSILDPLRSIDCAHRQPHELWMSKVMSFSLDPHASDHPSL
jgi:hypothetical protein